MEYIQTVLNVTLSQLMLFVVPGLVLALVMQLVAGSVEKRAYRLMGRGVYLMLFGWLGTAVHECGHALFCVIFRHRIIEMKLFSPDKESGTLGYVHHSFNPKSIYQRAGNFFIGIGPIILGSLVIFASSWFLLPSWSQFEVENSTVNQSLSDLIPILFSCATDYVSAIFTVENLSNWKFYFFLYICFSVGSSITLSVADLKGAASGLNSLVILILLFNILTTWTFDANGMVYGSVGQFFNTFYVILLFVLLINLFFRLLLSVIGQAMGKQVLI